MSLDAVGAVRQHGAMSLSITCPVESVERATAFYSDAAPATAE
ncbi:hypothetical protein [Herbiconiux liangxiaofengii]